MKKREELICHLSRFSSDLCERGRRTRAALAVDMDASWDTCILEASTFTKREIQHYYFFFFLPDIRHLPYIFSIDFICSVDMAKILLLSVGQAICEPINCDRWMLVRTDQKMYLKMMYWVTHDSLWWCLKP